MKESLLPSVGVLLAWKEREFESAIQITGEAHGQGLLQNFNLLQDSVTWNEEGCSSSQTLMSWETVFIIRSSDR